jgi:hypothetical protein
MIYGAQRGKPLEIYEKGRFVKRVIARMLIPRTLPWMWVGTCVEVEYEGKIADEIVGKLGRAMLSQLQGAD